eukprot:jgi/Botrbrau1/18225/Bobra.53_1s0082.1
MSDFPEKDFRTLRHLGSGSFGQCRCVRYCGQEALPPILCRKEMVKERKGIASELESFGRELSLLQSLDHPNIVKCFGGSQDSENPYMLLQYLEGGSLRKMLLAQMSSPGRRIYTDACALRWSTQLASALAFLHGQEQPVLHRDVHPENVMLTSVNPFKADICLIDFGLHRQLPSQKGNGDEAGCVDGGIAFRISCDSNGCSECSDDSSEADCKGCQPDDLIRTPDSDTIFTGQTGAYMYMSPEMLKGQPYGPATDVFSLGMLMYELFSGYLRSACLDPNGVDPHAVEKMAHKVAGGFRPQFPARVPQKVVALIRSCWAQNPADRPSSAEVLASLEGLSFGSGRCNLLSPSLSSPEPITLPFKRLLSRISGRSDT